MNVEVRDQVLYYKGTNIPVDIGATEGNPCEVCGTRDPEKPMCFRKTKWCCDDHRKIFQGEVVLTNLR